MAKKRTEKRKNGQKAVEDYYKLKTKAVEDLVTASPENSPPVSQEELDKYQGRKGKGIPNWLKVYFVKFWFPAAVCYFFFWGLSLYMRDMLDLLFVTAIALGVVTDILTNNALRFFASMPGDHDKYMMFPKKRYMTFIWNILYAGVLLAMVVGIYTGVNIAIKAIFQMPPDSIPLGVEPILFGLFYVLCDALLIGLKHLVVRLVTGAKNKKVQEG